MKRSPPRISTDLSVRWKPDQSRIFDGCRLATGSCLTAVRANTLFFNLNRVSFSRSLRASQTVVLKTLGKNRPEDRKHTPDQDDQNEEIQSAKMLIFLTKF